ncbi:MAG: glycosyltransferase [Bacilli bacterium]|nr:glycosyltransferase [Bacilli bacterium]
MEKLHTFVVLAYKESKDLEKCIKSVLNQKYRSEVLIGTSTPNNYISKMAKKYNLDVIVNKDAKHRIGDDFDFAIKCAKTKLVTVAHQDDIYDYEYSDEIVKKYNKNKDSLILFTDYYEIRNKKKTYKNTNLRIKSILLAPLKINFNSNKKWAKRAVLRFGNAICCPSVTFNKDLMEFPVFDCELTCNIDWNAWEKLSLKKGSFSFINKKLMGHKISEETTTTEIINSGVRTKEDYELFLRFWPKWIAKLLNKFYKNAEKSNKVKK